MTKRLFLLAAILFSTTVFAQDFSGVKVDDLTDAQIQQIYNQGQAQGLSIAEGEQMALNMGLSPEEAAKFKARLNKLQGGQKPAGPAANANLVTTEVAEKAETQVQNTAKTAGKVNQKTQKDSVTIYG